jgi:hypothetical protein
MRLESFSMNEDTRAAEAGRIPSSFALFHQPVFAVLYLKRSLAKI